MTEITKPPRIVGRPFRKGVSGNPGGRTKENQWLRDEARKHAAKSIRALVRVLDGGTGSEVVSAAKELLDRGFGKATQAINATVTVDASEMSDAALAEIVAAAAGAPEDTRH